MRYNALMLKKLPLLLAAALLPLGAAASSVHFGDYFLKGAETLSDDVYVMGENAVFAGAVSGDAFAAARAVLSEGEIAGDALFLGETVAFRGKVLDDLRALGAEIEIGGETGDDAVAVGSRVVLSERARIGGTLYAVGQEVDARGAIGGDVRIVAERVRFSGDVSGTLEVWGSDVSFLPPARIGGDFIHHANGKAALPSNVSIGGEVILDEAARTGARFSLAPFLGGFFALRTLMMLALGFALFFLVRERLEETLLDTLANFWPRVLRGALIILLLALSAALLFPTVVGIPLALSLGALLFLLLALSWGYAGILLGALCERPLFKRSPFPLFYRPVFFGIVLLALLSLVPFAGTILYGMLLLAGAGSFGTVFYRHLRRTE